jgi:hypothetical protein
MMFPTVFAPLACTRDAADGTSRDLKRSTTGAAALRGGEAARAPPARGQACLKTACFCGDWALRWTPTRRFRRGSRQKNRRKELFGEGCPQASFVAFSALKYRPRRAQRAESPSKTAENGPKARKPPVFRLSALRHRRPDSQQPAGAAAAKSIESCIHGRISRVWLDFQILFGVTNHLEQEAKCQPI